MTKKQVNLKLDPDELSQIEETAKALGMTRNDLFIAAAKALHHQIEEQKKSPEPEEDIPPPPPKKIEALPELSAAALAERCGTRSDIIINKRREIERQQRPLRGGKKYDYSEFIPWIRAMDPEGYGWQYNPYLYIFERVDPPEKPIN